MTPAIRILRGPRPSDTNIQAVEHDEQVLAIAKRIVEASGELTSERVEACAAKFRDLKRTTSKRSIEQITDDVTNSMMTAQGIRTMTQQVDFDLDRIMSMLEG